jgi:uncharacterized protein with ParB-like and HNH nuclease domain
MKHPTAMSRSQSRTKLLTYLYGFVFRLSTEVHHPGRSAMTNERRQSREVDGKGRTVRELLGGRKYSTDYYQREYKWGSKQVNELIDDLSIKFLESHVEGNERSAVADYGHYLLGSVIVSDKEGEKFIINGQV